MRHLKFTLFIIIMAILSFALASIGGCSEPNTVRTAPWTEEEIA